MNLYYAMISSYQTWPNNHILKTSYMAEKGRTMMPSMRSAHAKETMNKLVAPRNLCVILTAVMTIILPKMTMRQTNPKGTSDPKTLASSKLTLSKGELQFLIQITWFSLRLVVGGEGEEGKKEVLLLKSASCCGRRESKIDSFVVIAAAALASSFLADDATSLAPDTTSWCGVVPTFVHNSLANKLAWQSSLCK